MRKLEIAVLSKWITLVKPQAVGAYGEKVVEAELLRRDWLPANVNATVKNAADFDIFALKGDRAVQLRVKTCSPRVPAIQYNIRVGGKMSVASPRPSDFTIVVRMGKTRAQDEFYVVPTRVVREAVNRHIEAYLKQARRDGRPRKDTGGWSLRFADLKTGEDRPGYGFSRKWKKYRDNWESLEEVTP